MVSTNGSVLWVAAISVYLAGVLNSGRVQLCAASSREVIMAGVRQDAEISRPVVPHESAAERVCRVPSKIVIACDWTSAHSIVFWSAPAGSRRNHSYYEMKQLNVDTGELKTIGIWAKLGKPEPLSAAVSGREVAWLPFTKAARSTEIHVSSVTGDRDVSYLLPSDVSSCTRPTWLTSGGVPELRVIATTNHSMREYVLRPMSRGSAPADISWRLLGETTPRIDTSAIWPGSGPVRILGFDQAGGATWADWSGANGERRVEIVSLRLDRRRLIQNRSMVQLPDDAIARDAVRCGDSLVWLIESKLPDMRENARSIRLWITGVTGNNGRLLCTLKPKPKQNKSDSHSACALAAMPDDTAISIVMDGELYRIAVPRSSVAGTEELSASLE